MVGISKSFFTVGLAPGGSQFPPVFYAVQAKAPEITIHKTTALVFGVLTLIAAILAICLQVRFWFWFVKSSTAKLFAEQIAESVAAMSSSA